jgi:prepilin-type N-terminal cleavage/methylation domain-containing protein
MPAFTLIELLVVIVVIGILIAAIGLVGAKVMNAHKVKATENTLRSVKMAIDEFATLNPLASIYDQKDSNKTFGPYPPYMLDPNCSGTCVSWIVEDPNSLTGSAVLTNRLHRDMANRQGNFSDWVNIQGPDENDDIRALYTYLELYTPDTLTQLPKDVVKPLGTTPEFVNPTGAGTAPGSTGLVDVLGIYDAWGVPLNYFLYVKLEWTFDPVLGEQWIIADRVPVVMSHGHTKEEHVAEPAGGGEHELEAWILSDPFPSPAAGGQPSSATYAALKSNGTLPLPGSSALAGWARAKAAGDEYDYVP